MLKNKLRKEKDILNESIGDLSKIIDANSVVGKPILAYNNATIIPVSKITIAYLGGNGEYGDANFFSKNTHPSASGSGAIVNVNPNGFLYIDNTICKFVKTDDNAVDMVFDRATEFLQKAINDKN